ncbi:MAG: 30S ribosomal protein S9 [Zestosphaera sp.]
MSMQSSPHGLKVVIAVGKRKTAVAKAVIEEGKGRVWVNDVPIELWPVEMAKLKMMEPLMLAGENVWGKVDIHVYVTGGGVMAQADAVRTAIARALASFTNNEELRRIYSEYSRAMLAGDPRRTEPEKWMRYSARRFRQKSYR